jgi:Na+/H+-dicarboxylate symporter
VLLQFVVLLCGLMFVFTLVLYPIAVLAGRVSCSGFARAVYAGQLVAVSSRSSLASVPALLEGARTHLTLPPEALGFAMPFAAATFKVNRTISGPATLLFLAYWFGIELTLLQILTFVLTVMIMSFSSPGIPSGGDTFKTLPAYLAAGVPIEGVVLVKVVDVIPDVFKTLLNVTGYMTATVLLGRFVGKAARSERVGATEPAAAAEPTGESLLKGC